MRSAFLLLAVLLLTVGMVLANSGIVTDEPPVLNGNEPVVIPENLIGWIPSGELDQIVGDTVHVGTTPWDAQHNSKAARQIAFYDDIDWEVHIIWAKLMGMLPADPRHTVYTKVMSDGGGGFTIDPFPAAQVEDEYRSGYCTMAYDPLTNSELPGFHLAYNAGDPFHSSASIESPFIPLFYNIFDVPAIFAQPHVWPMSVYGSTGHLHMISHEQTTDDAGPRQVSYYRWSVDPAAGTLTPAMADPIIITYAAENISGDVVTNNDGSKVAISTAMARYYTIGELWGTIQDTQVNNDVYVFMSEDGGATWDLDNPIDATQYAYEDTMRVYADCAVIFDDTDNLHVAYSAASGDASTGTSYVTSRVYHYMQDGDGNDWWTMIYYQPFPGYAPEAWGRTADRPCMYFDDDTGILWMMFRAFAGGPNDYGSGSGQGNGDILISASPPGPYNGLLWTEPVNITNTNWTTAGGAPAGDCQSEMSPGMALDSNGDYLHISYLLDLDAGVAISTAPAGIITDNPYVYHRVAKQELLDMFEANAAWVHNFPMHVDSTGFWVDSGDWEWDQYGGFFTTNREPLADFSMTLINGTIPGGGGTVTYTVHFEFYRNMTIPGANYWTMVELGNGNMLGPIMMETFTVTPYMNATVNLAQPVPGWAPAGMYVYYGHVGLYPMSVLSDNFYIWKVAAGADGGDHGLEGWEAAGPDFNAAAGGDVEFVTELPSEYALSKAWPNPFNPATSMTVSLPLADNLTLAVYNVEGRLVTTLADGRFDAGQHTFTFDGSEFASGIYFVKATVPGKLNQVLKMTLIK